MENILDAIKKQILLKKKKYYDIWLRNIRITAIIREFNLYMVITEHDFSN